MYFSQLFLATTEDDDLHRDQVKQTWSKSLA